VGYHIAVTSGCGNGREGGKKGGALPAIALGGGGKAERIERKKGGTTGEG